VGKLRSGQSTMPSTGCFRKATSSAVSCLTSFFRWPFADWRARIIRIRKGPGRGSTIYRRVPNGSVHHSAFRRLQEKSLWRVAPGSAPQRRHSGGLYFIKPGRRMRGTSSPSGSDSWQHRCSIRISQRGIEGSLLGINRQIEFSQADGPKEMLRSFCAGMVKVLRDRFISFRYGTEVRRRDREEERPGLVLRNCGTTGITPTIAQATRRARNEYYARASRRAKKPLTGNS